jgi:hypothetical protein
MEYWSDGLKQKNNSSAGIAITPVLHHSTSMAPNKETIKEL